MGRLKGTPKTGGRKTGTPNKITGTLKEFITNLIDENREQIVKDIASLEPKDRIFIFERLMAYVIPKQAATKIQKEDEWDGKISIALVPSPAGHKLAHSEDEVDLERDERFLLKGGGG